MSTLVDISGLGVNNYLIKQILLEKIFFVIWSLKIAAKSSAEVEQKRSGLFFVKHLWMLTTFLSSSQPMRRPVDVSLVLESVLPLSRSFSAGVCSAVWPASRNVCSALSRSSFVTPWKSGRKKKNKFQLFHERVALWSLTARGLTLESEVSRR